MSKIIFYINPTIRAFAYTDLCLGTILMPSAIMTILKILKGSNSEFALVMMAFAIGYALTDWWEYLIDSLRHEEPGMPNPQFNFYAKFFNYTVYLLCSLQPWIFSMRYL
jgi:hypothetical protein